jgi:hypothetical protein
MCHTKVTDKTILERTRKQADQNKKGGKGKDVAHTSTYTIDLDYVSFGRQ